jgi:hypothetical protein
MKKSPGSRFGAGKQQVLPENTLFQFPIPVRPVKRAHLSRRQARDRPQRSRFAPQNSIYSRVGFFFNSRYAAYRYPNFSLITANTCSALHPTLDFMYS